MSNTTVNRQQTPNEAKAAIRACFKTNTPVFMWGAPGIGKSDIVHQVAAETGREVIDVRLSLWEPTDIKGIPFYNPTKNSMEWAAPLELPSDPDSTAVLFLDELNSAAPATQAAAYQLVLNRRVGNYILPKGVSIIAAGNRDGDKGVTYRMPAPLANRFLHLEIKVDHEGWESWAINSGIHEHVIGYLGFAKQDLNDFDPRSASRSFATPRSWATVSRFLSDDSLPENTLTDLVAGAIGEGLALKFMTHRKIAGKLPKAIDILTGKVTSFGDEKVDFSATYSLSISMCYELKIYKDKFAAIPEDDEARAAERAKLKADYDAMSENFVTFALNAFPAEVIVVALRTAMRQYELPFNQRGAFKEFTKRYGKVLVDAACSK